MRKKSQKALISLYIFFILWVTLFTRDTRRSKNSKVPLLGSSDGILVGYCS